MNPDKHPSDLWHNRNKYLRLLMVWGHTVSRRRFLFLFGCAKKLALPLHRSEFFFSASPFRCRHKCWQPTSDDSISEGKSLPVSVKSRLPTKTWKHIPIFANGQVPFFFSRHLAGYSFLFESATVFVYLHSCLLISASAGHSRFGGEGISGILTR